MRVLDICCCAGGATKGYQRAGAHVTGVDIVARPRYIGDEFVQADALTLMEEWTASGEIQRFDLIHMSWPCQNACTLVRGTQAAQGVENRHPQLVPRGRELAVATGLPWVIEQPQGHGGLIRTDLRLCMDMFPIDEPPWVQRHRDFEISGFEVHQPVHARGGRFRGHRGRVRGWRHRVLYDGPYVQAYGRGGRKAEIPDMQHALGIDWTDVREELTEAIPPAYTEYIGSEFLRGR